MTTSAAYTNEKGVLRSYEKVRHSHYEGGAGGMAHMVAPIDEHARRRASIPSRRGEDEEMGMTEDGTYTDDGA